MQPQVNESEIQFSVKYQDAAAIKISSLGDNNVLVSGGGFSQLAKLVSVEDGRGKPLKKDAPLAIATYKVTAPDKEKCWTTAQSGNFTVSLLPNQVQSTSGAFVPPGIVQTFELNFVGVPAELIHTEQTKEPESKKVTTETEG